MDNKMEARLRDEVIVAGYEALPDVYEWLIPDAKLTPEGSVAALGDLVQSLPSNARVLDCSSGTGSLRSASPVSAWMLSPPTPARGWSAGHRNSLTSTAFRCRHLESLGMTCRTTSIRQLE
jgi:hypothetical protein